MYPPPANLVLMPHERWSGQVGWAPRGTLGSSPHLRKTHEADLTLNHTSRIVEGLFLSK